MSMIWPIALIVLSNVVYNLCAKSTPGDIHPLASLSVTYAVGAIAAGVLYFAFQRGGDLLREYRHLNWTTFALGLAIVGLEAGSIYMYKAGWSLGAGQLVHSSILAIALILIGCLFYREPVSGTKILGMLICMIGLYFVNR